ncbi:hypothetical protein PEX2_086770 [Penicillium expansum]|uniref:NACHT-NTPase and P-loop NTPases N-terminal domain-containing protein n=1 Tax=Penicillium expansum TaxID=27334 RepID=A0A0A2K7Z0_PENEN|nr:hypothetical protein PEX2_086770 [Penicillium expansum]KGO60495.1 hypothetical protein PEX2_086770 [Penicillium expansum]
MAEVIGVVSGAIKFATVIVQIGKTVITLKECYDDLRDAPDDLRKLVQQIEIFGKILVNVESDLSRNPNLALESSEAALQSLAYCKEAANELDKVCNNIVRDVKFPSRLRRSFKSARVVLQKGRIEKHMDHLRNVLQLLMWSEQCYHRALTQAHIEARSQLIIETMVKLNTASSSSSSSRITTTLEEAESPPSHIKSAVISQNQRLKCDQNNSSYKFVTDGNIKGLQDLFASRQASPFDRLESPDGRSLIHLVGRRNRTEMVSFLLDQGVDLNSLDEPPLLSGTYYSEGTPDLESLIPSMRLILRHKDVSYECTHGWVVNVLGNFQGTLEEFAFLQRQICPSFYDLPKQTRLRVARSVAGSLPVHWNGIDFTPDIVRMVLKIDVLDSDDIACCSDKTPTLIHSAAKHIGAIRWLIQRLGGSNKHQSRIDTWIELCREFLRVTNDIHTLVQKRTPFISFVVGYLRYWTWNPPNPYSVQMWLEQLETVSVDLNEYGRTEESIWKSGTIQREFGSWNGHLKEIQSLRVIGFAYGPSPEDWRLWLSEPSDSYVGDFWRMVARPVEVMPGAWPQE